jgi:CRISPR-associated endoribonuclease Cas6
MRARPYKVGRVEKIYTITPAVLTFERNRYWTPEDDLQILVRSVRENLRKKYRHFFKKEIDAPEDFINYYEVINEKPIVFNYKGGKILANRFIFGFGDDAVSQKLAFGVGVLEKNALGFGMVVRGKDDR